MNWRDLLDTRDEGVVTPWVGGRQLHREARTWRIEGKLPPEPGWYRFTLSGRRASVVEPASAEPELLGHRRVGYLVGDRLLADGVRVASSAEDIVRQSERVFLIPRGVNRFTRMWCGRTHFGGALIFGEEEMPLGPEDEVLEAFLAERDGLDEIPNVSPALDAAFRMEVYQKHEAARRRAELEQRRREEEARREQEEQQRAVVEHLGDGHLRRALAAYDFEEAARAALAIGGAIYLDHRPSINQGEMVVTFRMLDRRFECSCDAWTLQIIDSGICLIDHRTGERGDTYFTLESLPGVIRQADLEERLVVFRHAD